MLFYNKKDFGVFFGFKKKDVLSLRFYIYLFKYIYIYEYKKIKIKKISHHLFCK